MNKQKIRLLYLVMIGFFSLGFCYNVQAQNEVSGMVTSADDGNPLPGVNIVVKGTSTGTTTDAGGNYELGVSSSADTLIFSFIGFQRQEVPINGRTAINVELTSITFGGEEVVVTAFGLERGKKSLTYSTQEVETEDLAKARELNVVNSLSGKVAGISVNQASTGVGGSSRVILRGNRSINGSSQPLYVVDGVPIQGDINGLDPNNIASINVLKGPNAAALYGSDANNGVIIVTTKKGTAGAVKVSISENFTKSDPILLTDYQNVYGQGNAGNYSRVAEQNWGPKMEGQMVDMWSPDPELAGQQYPYSPQPDNVKDAFQSGYSSATNIGVSMGTEKTQYYFSYGYTNSTGVVPNNKLDRNNVNLRVNSELSDKFSLDAKLNYIRRNIDNSLSTGESFSNPLRMIYRLPRNIRTQDAENFEYTDASGANRQNFWNPGSNGGANPYWTMNRNLNGSLTERVIALGSLTYDFTDNLSLMVRSSLDRYNTRGETKQSNDTYIIAQYGYYGLSKSEGYKWNSDALLTYKNTFSEDWDVNVNLGANLKKERNTGLNSNTGDALVIPNFFALSNTQKVVSTENVGSPNDVQSLYGAGSIGFKNAIYLDLSGRNDWSSTLPAGNRSFFYPSIGLTAVLSDLLPTFPEWFTLAKLRASYAEVGNGTAPFMTKRTANFSAGGNSGFLQLNPTIPNANLVPERTKSIEIGADLAFFRNRLGLDLTYYKTNSENQLFTVALPVGSGASSYFTNGGNVQNKGIEATLSVTPVSTHDFNWDIEFNFSRNLSLVKKINDERPSIVVSTDFLRQFRIEEGKPWGEVYSRGFLRDEQGRIIVNDNGIPETSDGLTVRVANYSPDWLGGIRNSLYYKNLSLGFLIDIRQGGSIASLTNAILYADGQTKATLTGRDGSLVFGQNVFSGETAVKEDGTPNDIAINAEDFWNAIGGRNTPVGEAFVSDASNVRMREVTLGYTIPKSKLSGLPISDVQISFVARNLFFFYNASDNLDPDVMVGTSKSVEGFESFTVPNSRTYGFNVKVDL